MAPAAIRGDTVWCVGMSEPDAGSDLANLSTRAVRRRRLASSSPARRCGRATPWSPSSASATSAPTPTVRQAQGHLGAHHRHGHARASRCGRCATSPARPSSPRCSSTRSSCPKANLVGELNDGWRITMGSLAHERGGLWVEGVAGAQRAVDGLVAMARRRGLDRDPVVRRQLAELATRRSGRCGRSATRASRRSRRARRPPSTRFMKLASSELRQRLYELGMDLQGAVRHGHRARAVGGGRPLAARPGRSRWRPPSAAARRRSSATSWPPGCLGLPRS